MTTSKAAALVAASIALVALFVMTRSVLLAQAGAQQAGDAHAQAHADLAEAAKVEAQAMSALGIGDSGCSKVADPLFREVAPTDIDAAAKNLAGPGWAAGRFVGSIDELAAAEHAKIAASGSTTAWTIWTDGGGHLSAREYHRVDLPSGKVAWQPGQVVAVATCGEPVD